MNQRIQFTHGISADQNKRYLLASFGGRASSHHYYTDDDNVAKMAARSDLLDQFEYAAIEARRAYALAMHAK